MGKVVKITGAEASRLYALALENPSAETWEAAARAMRSYAAPKLVRATRSTLPPFDPKELASSAKLIRWGDGFVSWRIGDGKSHIAKNAKIAYPSPNIVATFEDGTPVKASVARLIDKPIDWQAAAAITTVTYCRHHGPLRYLHPLNMAERDLWNAGKSSDQYPDLQARVRELTDLHHAAMADAESYVPPAVVRMIDEVSGESWQA